jgi:hypothetical protein
MTLKQIPLTLALALAIGGLVSACSQEQHATTNASATAEAGHAEARAHAGTEEDGAHAAAVANAGGTDFPVPANHVRWTPDAALVEGMSRVRTALAGLEASSHPDDATVRALAGEIDAAVAYMFANCKLPTEPDVALHAILARLMANTRALEANPSDGSPVADMHDALHNYQALFADPAM